MVLENQRSRFIHSPKIGMSFRTDNSLMTFNVTEYQRWMNGDITQKM
jgi:hypothetical protein